MHFKKRILSVLLVIACTAGLIYSGNGSVGERIDFNRPGTLLDNKETIYFWYTDEQMTSFLNSAAVEFGQEKGVRVIPVLTSEGEYLEAIGRTSLEDGQTPDLYLIPNDSLEKAYLAGLASATTDGGTVCNTDYFPEASLAAVNYHGKNIAYPLYYETSVLLYNDTYLQDWIGQQQEKLVDIENGKEVTVGGEDVTSGDIIAVMNSASLATLEDILTVANTFDVPEEVDCIMKWDVSDIFYNYWFVGSYLNVGGLAGDDEETISIHTKEAAECLKAYQSLNQFFSIESDTITYESVIDEFIQGKVMFTVATSDIIARMEQAKEDGSFPYEYGITTMPRVSEELGSAPLSMTGAVVVNGYTTHKQLANEFAIYLVTQCADDLYQKTGKISANALTEVDNGAVSIFHSSYANSASLPKMMETGNFWIQLEVLFSKVWNGADVEEQLDELDSRIRAQISAE